MKLGCKFFVWQYSLNFTLNFLFWQ